MNRLVVAAIAMAGALCAGSPAAPAGTAPVPPGDRVVGEVAMRAPLEPLVRSNRFVYRIARPDRPDGTTLVLLHGSGGNETSLFAMARASAPASTLIGVRGRLVQNGRNRWYRRLTPVSFDQADIRREAAAFADFLMAEAKQDTLVPERTVFIGFSNGANLLAAIALLHPGLVRRAVLLRPMSVLDDPPEAALSGLDLLVLAGRRDRTYGPLAPALEALMKSCGANVRAQTVDAGHMVGALDSAAVARWLATDPGATPARPDPPAPE